jgi:citrate lyase beta subunit
VSSTDGVLSSANSSSVLHHCPIHILLPMVCTDHEIEAIADMIKRISADICHQINDDIKYTLGASLEVPRACLRANDIASEGDVSFLQFETDSLTEMVYGLSKEESKKILPVYTSHHIIKKGNYNLLLLLLSTHCFYILILSLWLCGYIMHIYICRSILCA